MLFAPSESWEDSGFVDRGTVGGYYYWRIFFLSPLETHGLQLDDGKRLICP